MAAGRCVVASDISPHRTLLDDGAAGVLHRVGDAADLARQLRRVLLDHAARRKIARRGHEVSLAYTWTQTAAIHADALRRAAGRRHRRVPR
jgi:glycosyltransferase involved in cell wall biosynthesis